MNATTMNTTTNAEPATRRPAGMPAKKTRRARPPAYAHLVSAFGVFLFMVVLLAWAQPARAQDWFRTGTGLGVSKPRVAVADFVPRDAPSQTLATLFSQVVANDLDYSGILDLASKSFYPTQTPSIPAELNSQAWNAPPASAQYLAFGN